MAPPTGFPSKPGLGSGTLSSCRRPGRGGVAEGRAGARAGGWERPSSGVKIIFTSATSEKHGGRLGAPARSGTEEVWAGRFPSQGPRPVPGQAVPRLEPQCRRLQALPLGVPRPRTAARPAPSRPSQCPPRAVCGSTRRRSTPQQGHSRARSGRRSGLTVPGRAAWPQVPSRSASRPAVQALRPRALSRQRGKPPRLSLLWGPQHVHSGSWWAL